MTRRPYLAAALAAGITLLAACTGGSGAAAPSTTQASSSSAQPAPSTAVSPPASSPSTSPGSTASGSSGSSTPASESGTPTAPADGDTGNPAAVPGVPTDETRVAQAIDGVDEVAQEMFDRSGLPGMAVAVVHGGETVFARGYGVRKVGEPGDVDPDTVFQMASLSKPVAATVVAKEVGEGTVTWTTPVADNLPGFALSDPYVAANVTIADMFSHRSGLPNHGGDDLEDLGYDRQEILSRFKYMTLNPFRAVYNYTNYGLTAAAESVANAAGTDWSALSRQNIYGPLGMDDTSSDYADFAAAANHAAGHVKVNGAYAAAYLRDADGQSPAGGLSSTVNDFASWMSMVLAGGSTPDGTQVVEGEALRAAMTPAIRQADGSPVPASVDGRSGFYGYGFGVGHDASGRVRLSHSGAFGAGAGTSFTLIPNLDLGIVVLTNGAAEGTAEGIVNTFADMAEFGTPQRDWYAAYHMALAGVTEPQGELVGETPPASPAPAAANRAYVGTYQSDYFGPATVSEADGGLVLTAGPRGDTFPLTHWDGSVFTLKPVGDRGPDDPAGENVDDGSISQVTFVLTGDTATAVTVEAWDKEGLGTFAR